MTPRLACGRTHLFPGARLTPEAPLAAAAPGAVVVAFADGVEAPGRLAPEADPDAGPPGVLRLDLAAHVTAAGTPIPARAWRLAPDPSAEAPGRFRVLRRLGRG